MGERRLSLDSQTLQRLLTGVTVVNRVSVPPPLPRQFSQPLRSFDPKFPVPHSYHSFVFYF